MNRSIYMCGFLLIVFTGFLLIYSVLKGLYFLEQIGFSTFVAGLIICVIGIAVPEERMKTAWISIGSALLISMFINVLIILTPNIYPTIFAFPLLFIVIFVIVYIAITLIKRETKSKF